MAYILPVAGGKGGVGKSIYSLFNSLNNLENKILSQKATSVRTLCRRVVRDLLAHRTAIGEFSRPTTNLIVSLSRSITNLVMEEYQKWGSISFESLQGFLRYSLERAKMTLDADAADDEEAFEAELFDDAAEKFVDYKDYEEFNEFEDQLDSSNDDLFKKLMDGEL